MALKIPWEQDEAVILLDALIKVRNGDITRKEAVANISKELRQRAINKGIEIDEIFRNTNGIGLQMSFMEYIVTNGKQGMPQASKLFKEAVKLYNENRDEFERILIKAKKNINPDFNNDKIKKINKQDDLENLSEENIKARRMAFKNWLKGNGVSESSMSNYAFALNAAFVLEQCGTLAMRLSLSDKNLFFIEDIETLRNIRAGLLANKLRDKQVDKYISVLNKYIEFCNDGKPEVFAEYGFAEKLENTTIDAEKLVQADDKNIEAPDDFFEKTSNEFEMILKEDFPNGFRPNSAIDKSRFRKFFFERFGSDLLESDEFIVEQLDRIGVQRDGRIFIKNDYEQQQIIQNIIDDMGMAFDNGATCVYVDAIWERYQKPLSDNLSIYNIEALTELLKKELQGKYNIFYNKYFCAYNRQADTYQDVLNCLKSYNTPVTYETLFNSLWFLPPDKIKQILSTYKIFVCTARGHYFYAPNLPVSEEELAQVTYIINAELSNRNYISDVEMYNLLQEKCPIVVMNTEEFSMLGLRNVLGYLLRDTFSFNGKIITLKDKQINLSEAFAEFCQFHEKLTLSEIKDFAQEMETTINWNIWNTIRQKMLRISETEFVQFDSANFDISLIDEMLESLCPDEYVPIQSVGLFMHFPPIGIQWNSYVLESYVYALSNKFCLVNASFVENGCYGAIVRKNSVFVDYQKLVVDALAHSQNWNTTKDALEFLIQEGYQSSRRFSKIDNVVKEAKILREQLNKSRE